MCVKRSCFLALERTLSTGFPEQITNLQTVPMLVLIVVKNFEPILGFGVSWSGIV